MVVDLRNDLRNLSQNENDSERKKQMFQTGDKYRDKLFKEFNVKIEDLTNLWKFVDAK